MMNRRHSELPEEPRPLVRIAGWSQHDRERLLFVVKRHPLTLLLAGLLMVVCWLIPYGFYVVRGTEPSFWWSVMIAGGVGLVIGYRSLFSWQHSNYVLTSERVISISQLGFFSRSVAEAQLPNILSVRYDVPGVVRSIFNFGTVTVQSSGVKEEGDVILLDIPNPFRYQEEIAKAQSQAE